MNLKTLLVLVFVFFLKHASSQVLVHEEPFHKPVFKGKDVRILNVVVPPGDTSLYHLHHTPSLFIFFTPTATGTQLQGQGPRAMRFTKGWILFENLAAPNTRIHRVWNEDREDLHVMDVELLYSDSGFKTPPLKAGNFKLEVDTPWVRAYKVELPAGGELNLKKNSNPMILVSLDAATVETGKAGKMEPGNVGPGSFYQVRKKNSFYLKNTSSGNIQFALVELPVK